MSAIFQAIRNFFHFIASSVSNVVTLLRRLLSLLGNVAGYVTDVLQLFPTWLYVVIIVLIGVCVLYKILGREGNS